MRFIIAILLFISINLSAQFAGGSASTNAAHVSSGIPWTNLISCWPGNETSGGIAYDVHGSDNASVTGATQTSGGLVCDGTDDYITISPDAFGNSTFTWIMEINPTSSGVYRSVIGGASLSFWLALYENDRPRALIVGGAGSNVTSISLNYGVPNMLAVTRDGSNFKFFINGVFETETFTANYTTGCTTIGESSGGYADFLGTFGNVFLFSDVKTESYITAFYNGGDYTNYEDGDPE